MTGSALNSHVTSGEEIQSQGLNSESSCPSPSLDDLQTCELLSTTNSETPLQHDAVRSTYHIYRKGEQNACISPTINASKERWWGPTVKEQKASRKLKKLEAARRKEDGYTDSTHESGPETDISQGTDAFFVHTPYLSFHDPPRVLYIGNSRHTEPAILIHSQFMWRTYKLQMGPSIATPGLLDPRGVVCWRHNGGDKKALKTDDRKLKGYKVSSWRLWGETGKDYVHNIKAMRKAGKGPDPDIIEDEVAAKKAAIRADEVVYLKWTSPFSRNTRRYHFKYANIDFYWKGTGTVKETRRCGMWCHFNHLKLVAELPTSKGDTGPRPEVCLAKYTSSIAQSKFGTLEVFDGAVWRLAFEHIPLLLAQNHNSGPIANRTASENAVAEVTWIKQTSLYRVIVATAMCMVYSENQKRETIRKVIEAAATEGGGGGG